MIKKVILGISLLFTSVLLAQEGTASPYSFYGIGDVKFKGTNENKAMGGIGVLADSIHVNLQNPATYAGLKYTSLSIGGTNTRTHFKTNSQEEDAQRTSLDYLAVGLPLGKFGAAFGLIPYSVTGYKIQNNFSTTTAGITESRTQMYTGQGGINRVFLGGGFKVTPKLSFGVDLQYNFGSIETKSIVFITEPVVPLGSRTKNESTYNGFSVSAGLFYQTKFQNKLDWYSSLTFAPKSRLHAENERNVATVSYNIVGTEFISESRDVEIADSKLTLPSKLSLGTAFGINKKWFVGTEFTFQSENNMGSQGSIDNVSFEKSTRFALGGYYIPKYNSFRNYFDRIVYRAGMRHETTGLVLNDKSIKDTAVSLGFGFPVGTSISNINLGLEYGKKGTRANGLIEENYFNISIGLSFSDRWFIKQKYD